MTTIVYANGTLAVDSRVTVNGWTQGSHLDKLRLSMKFPGTAYAFTGDVQLAVQFIDWLEGIDPDRPGLDSEARVIALDADGLVQVYEGNHRYEHRLEEGQFLAWGSGAAPALGALWAGADAFTAVACAAQVDPGTGGPVQTVSLETLQERRRGGARSRRRRTKCQK